MLDISKGVSPINHGIYQLHVVAFGVCVAISLGVFSALIYLLVMHRKSRAAQASKFQQSIRVELIWAVIPLFLSVAMAAPAAYVLLKGV